MAPGSVDRRISSLGSQRVLDNYVLVGVSKAALEALVRYLGVELAPREIRVNGVSAASSRRARSTTSPTATRCSDFYRARTPAGRLVEPEDVADAVASSPRPPPRWCAGRRSVVNGG